MSTSRLANQKQSTQAFIETWKKLSIDEIVGLRTPECVQEALPRDSLQMPDQTNEELVAAVKPVFATLRNFKANILSVSHDAETGRSTLYATTTADATWGNYLNTHIFIFTWNEDGTKMTRVQDMVDSATTLSRFEMIRKWQAEQKQA